MNDNIICCIERRFVKAFLMECFILFKYEKLFHFTGETKQVFNLIQEPVENKVDFFFFFFVSRMKAAL